MGRVLVNGQRTLPHSIMVNRRGRRFTNEAANYNAFGGAFHVEDVSRFEYANLPCWLVFDQTYVDKYGFRVSAGGGGGQVPAWVPRGDTPAELAAALDIDGDELERDDRALERQLRRRARSRLRARRQRLRLLVGRPAPQGPARRHARAADQRAVLRVRDPQRRARHQGRAAGRSRRAGARPRRRSDPRPVRRRQRDGLAVRDDLRRARAGRSARRWSSATSPAATRRRARRERAEATRAPRSRRCSTSWSAPAAGQRRSRPAGHGRRADEGARPRRTPTRSGSGARSSGSSSRCRCSSRCRATCASRASTCAYDIAGRPIVVIRGDDGRVRTFLNVCRHRGARVADEHCGSARRLTCPYHAWSYDRQGELVGVPGRETFGDVDATGLVELPTEERVGAVFAVLDPEATLDLDAWLGGMAELARRAAPRRAVPVPACRRRSTARTGSSPPTATSTATTSATCTGTRSAARRSPTATPTTCSARTCAIGFATKLTALGADVARGRVVPADYMSLVHYIFPNVSISGGHGDTLMLSRLLPGPTVDRSTTVQFQYYREPVVGELVAIAEEKRMTYEAVVRDEDCATIFGINDGARPPSATGTSCSAATSRQPAPAPHDRRVRPPGVTACSAVRSSSTPSNSASSSIKPRSSIAATDRASISDIQRWPRSLVGSSVPEITTAMIQHVQDAARVVLPRVLGGVPGDAVGDELLVPDAADQLALHGRVAARSGCSRS